MPRVNVNTTKSKQSQVSTAKDTVSVLSILRLMLPKLGVGFPFAMLLSVYNRVMIDELAIVPIVIGIMYLLYNIVGGFGQVTVGRISDRRPIFGLRRSPYLLIGLLLSSLALVPLHSVTMSFAAGNSIMLFAMLAIMAVFGVGFALCGDAHNSLIAEITAGKKNRSSVIATVWLFQILSSIASAIIISIILQVADTNAGAPKACVTEACNLIRRTVALNMMPTFFGIGPIIALLGWLPVLGLEPRLTIGQLHFIEQRPELNLKQAYTRIFTNRQALAFFFFIFASIFALFMQDDILEPFGGKVFGLSVSATSQFQPIMGGVTLVGMMIMGLVASRWPIPKRLITVVGSVIAGVGLLLLGIAAMTIIQPVLYLAIATLGLGMGVFNIGALSMMMDMTIPGETGSLMGAWGMAQAVSTGLANFMGTGILQVGLALTGGNASVTYAMIFFASAGFCMVAITLVRRVNIEKFHKLTREQMGMVLEAA